MNPKISQKQIWTALIAVDGIGPSTFFALQNQLKKKRISWQQFWDRPSLILGKNCKQKKILKSIQKFKKEHSLFSYWRRLQEQQVRVVCLGEKDYPALLAQIDQPPPVLFYQGSLQLCQKLPIAVVGTRRMTSYGQMAANKFGQELATHQATVVSGFMYGVDVTAQQAAVQAEGKTVGVLAFGFDNMAPQRHQPIYTDFLAKGNCFVSEYAPHVRPNKGTFRQRNRLVAGLSLGVVVIEAAVKSGTQVTVNYALDFGRDVFAVPGSINNPYTAGTRMMLNKGAMLVISGKEVLDNLSLLNWGFGKKIADVSQKPEQSCKYLDFTRLQKQIIEVLKLEQLSTNQLVNRINSCHNQSRSISELLTQLSLLEIRGLVKKQAGRWLATSKVCV